MKLNQKLLSGLTIVVAIGAGCDNETAEQKDAQTLRHIGIEASMTANFFVSADRHCQAIGERELSKCAESEGVLLDEQIARALVKAALEKTNKYFEKCGAAFSDDYCTQLVNRAVYLERRKPSESN